MFGEVGVVQHAPESGLRDPRLEYLAHLVHRVLGHGDRPPHALDFFRGLDVPRLLHQRHRVEHFAAALQERLDRHRVDLLDGDALVPGPDFAQEILHLVREPAAAIGQLRPGVEDVDVELRAVFVDERLAGVPAEAAVHDLRAFDGNEETENLETSLKGRELPEVDRVAQAHGIDQHRERDVALSHLLTDPLEAVTAQAPGVDVGHLADRREPAPAVTRDRRVGGVAHQLTSRTRHGLSVRDRGSLLGRWRRWL